MDVKKKNKIIIIVAIVMVLLIALLYLFGLIDFIRTKNGKKPIFVYSIVNVANIDVGITGFEDTILPHKESVFYYGVGYSVTLCDNETNNYTFKLGHKKSECYTDVTCTKTDDLKVKRNYEYSFFDNKLYKINKIYQVPIDKAYYTSEEKFKKENNEFITKINDIKGCAASYKKINEEEFEVREICNLYNIPEKEILEVYKTYLDSIEQPSITKEELLNYYKRRMICE